MVEVGLSSGTESGACTLLVQRSFHEVRLMFRDKETRVLEAALMAAVPLSVLLAVAMVSITFGWFG